MSQFNDMALSFKREKLSSRPGPRRSRNLIESWERDLIAEKKVQTRMRLFVTRRFVHELHLRCGIPRFQLNFVVGTSMQRESIKYSVRNHFETLSGRA